MFDLDYLTNSINYEPVSVENQANKSIALKEANSSAGTQDIDVQGANLKDIDLNEEHFVLPIWSAYSSTIKSTGDKIEPNIDFKTSKSLRKEATHDIWNANISSTNLLNTVSTPLSTVGPSRAFNDSELSYPDDTLMPHLEDIYSSPSEEIFTDSSYDDKGVVTDFNNLEIIVKQKEDGIFIIQDKYVVEILKKFDFLSVKTSSTPIETQNPLVRDEEAADVDVHLYRSMIGSLMYLTVSRPDIVFAACACSRFQVTPKTSHLQAVKRIFGDYAGANLERKSTTRGCQFLGKRLISWQCKRQTIVATSTTETEYVAATHYCGPVLWIQNQLLDNGFNFMNTKIYIDYESIICIVKNPVFHSKIKHIEIRHHFIRDAYEKKVIQVLKIHIDDNVADLLTKDFDVS
nr:putative ribonuclease H-like domain-containing protein [Tanacetum cinerariifolium]